MNEYLLIENFGPIDEVILDDIRPLTVFIGESGSGKSTIMKVLSLFRWMYKRVNAFIPSTCRYQKDRVKV